MIGRFFLLVGVNNMLENTHYLYKIQPTRLEMLLEGPTEAEDAVVSEHFAYLQRLTEQGVVVLAGRTLTTDADSFGIVILKVSSEVEARAIVNGDPAVQHGVMRATLYPYRISLMGRQTS